MEVDGVLGERHEAVMQGGVGRGCYILCAPAFRPLVGKQGVAWRFMQPDTLVYAVRTAGCSAAATEGGEEDDEVEEEGEEGDNEEGEEGCDGVKEAGAMDHLPASRAASPRPQACHTDIVMIKVNGLACNLDSAVWGWGQRCHGVGVGG